MRSHIIGIAGPSSSGKSELARQLVREAARDLDRFPRFLLSRHGRDPARRAQEGELRSSRCARLGTAPRAPAGHRPRAALSKSRSTLSPDYARTGATRRIEPSEFIIVEGLFVLYWPELRAMLDTKVYVQTDAAVCFERRLARDVAERGRTPESVREQYERTVRPSAEWFVFPTAKYADLVVSGEEPLDRSTAAVIHALHKAKAAAG